jgi:hypothetical protein
VSPAAGTAPPDVARRQERAEAAQAEATTQTDDLRTALLRSV